MSQIHIQNQNSPSYELELLQQFETGEELQTLEGQASLIIVVVFGFLLVDHNRKQDLTDENYSFNVGGSWGPVAVYFELGYGSKPAILKWFKMNH